MLETIMLTATVYVGEINEVGKAKDICKSLNEGDIIIFDSNGGIVDEFLELGNCIYDKKVNSIIIKARSAAAFAASAADKTCIYEDSILGYHIPHHIMGRERVELSIGQLRQHNSKLSYNLNKWGIDPQTVVNINYAVLMTPPALMLEFVGEDIVPFVKDVAWCKDLIIEEENIGEQ